MKWVLKQQPAVPFPADTAIYESGLWSIVFVSENRWAVYYAGAQSDGFELGPLNDLKRDVVEAVAKVDAKYPVREEPVEDGHDKQLPCAECEVDVWVAGSVERVWCKRCAVPEQTFTITFTARLDPTSENVGRLKEMLLDTLFNRVNALPRMSDEDEVLAKALLDEGVS